MTKPIGFIGLGNMGNYMVQSLLKKGVPVFVHDVNKDAIDKVVKLGAKMSKSPRDIAQQTKSIVTMLPNSSNVEEVYSGKNGIFRDCQEDSLLIDCSTIDPSTSRNLEQKALEHKSVFMDAPVSGGVGGARDGTLTFMVGGDSKIFERTKKILENMGKNIVHCGPVGSGQAAKICNNMLLGISMIGTAEAMNLGIKLGLEPKLLASILNSSSGQCWSSLKYNPCPGVVDNIPSSNDYVGGFGTSLMTKDLGLAQTCSTMTQAPTPLGSMAHQIYRIMCNSGYATKDFASIFKFLQEMDKKS